MEKRQLHKRKKPGMTSNAAGTEEETTDGNIEVQDSAIKLPANAFSSCSS